MAEEKKPVAAAVPDPDEDDLDELDDVLDQFQNVNLAKDTPSKKPDSSDVPSKSPAADSKSKTASAQDVGEEADFAKQLETGMQEMLRELESNPEMAKQFEDMMRQFGPPPGSDLSGLAEEAKKETTLPEPLASAKQAPADAAAGAPEPNFQDTIRRTLDRMQQSNATAEAATASKGGAKSEDDIMSALLQEIANSAGGEGGDDSFSNMLLGMMEQLTNKEILYEPMKDLNDKFPAWLAERAEGAPKASELGAEERKRYEEQSAFVKEIVERFERDGYSDQNPEDREYIVNRMQKMQAAGAPPQELVGDMGAASEMLGGVDNGCPQQ